MSVNQAFQWKCQPGAEGFILKVLQNYVDANGEIKALEKHLLTVTSSRLFDWLDHVSINYSEEVQNELEEYGFVADHATPAYRVFHHPGAQLPRIVMCDHSTSSARIAVSVDSIADFLMIRGKTGWIEGSSLSGYRRCCLSTEGGVSLWVVERRGIMIMEPTYFNKDYLEKILEATEKWQSRPRDLEDENEAIHRTIMIAEEIVDLIGEDRAACLILECERKYWQARNSAAQVQKNRQDRLGMGWANHDHHTFRSSRAHFNQLVRLFEMLGFHCRERFYAGKEAGWGAQVMENPNSRLVLFLDVDLAPNEVEVDFAHLPMPELPHLGTIGLWCALHGDSILKAGMHHLEAQFLFEELSQDLRRHGIEMMEPFSNFDYLKQAFTSGEIWHVDPRRIRHLQERGKISKEEAEKFSAYGAVGSHLENLQRREGYKGFNQKNVSVIIRKTDPRAFKGA